METKGDTRDDGIINVGDLKVGKNYPLDQRVRVYFPVYSNIEDDKPEYIEFITTLASMVTYECPNCGDEPERWG